MSEAAETEKIAFANDKDQEENSVTITNMTTCYKEQVLGKRCWIKFQVDNGNEKVGGGGGDRSSSSSSSCLVPFAGTVKAYKAELRRGRRNNKNIYTQHYIAFDDGESLWFNLQIEESQGRLSWQETNNAASISPETATSAAIKQEEEVDDDEQEEDAKPPAVPHVGSMNPQTAPVIAVKQEDDDDATDSEEESEDDDSEYNTNDEMDDDDNERSIHPPLTIVSSSPAAAAAAGSNSNRKRAAAAAASHQVTPDSKPKKKLRQLTMSGEFSWLDDFHYFLTHVPHGPNHTICSSKKSKSIIMSQVTKLVFGKGISHSSWQPKGVLFQSDIVKVNNNFNILDLDLDAMYQQAVDFEKNHGCSAQQQQQAQPDDAQKKTKRTSGQAWILRNPIKKLQYYKAHVLQEQQQQQQQQQR